MSRDLLSTIDPRTGVARGQIWVLWVLVAIGVLLRLAWLALPSSPKTSLGEAANVAVSIAQHGTIANSFYAGQGPTAHVMPIPPIIAGAVYHVFGALSPLSEAVLTGWSLLVVFAAFFVLLKCFEELGSPYFARLAAFATLCVVPLNFNLEGYWFRTWDGGIAAAAGPAAYLLTILRLDQKPSIGRLDVVGTGFLAAALMFISPPMGVGGYVCGAILLVRKLPLRQWVSSTAIVAAALAIVLAPWTLRNMAVMGEPIALRDNFGLEFAQGNYSAALTNPDREAQFAARHKEIHPWENAPVIEKFKAAGGEIKYSKLLEAETKAWVSAHPVEFAKLSLRHFSEFVFPPAWYWGAVSRGTLLKVIATGVFSAGAICAVVFGMAYISRRYVYLAVMIAVPVIPYIFVQPILRYRYIIFGILVFLTWDFLVRIAMLAAGRARFQGLASHRHAAGVGSSRTTLDYRKDI